MKLSDFKPEDETMDAVNYVLRRQHINVTALELSFRLEMALSCLESAAHVYTDLLLYAAQLQARVRDLEAQVKDKNERLEDLLDSQP